MTLSIVYVNFNKDVDLISSVKSLLQETNSSLSLQIIVVDNSPTVNLATEVTIAELLMSRHTACLAYLIPKMNLGFGKACNFGAQSAMYDYLLFLNCDTLILDDTLNSSYQYLAFSPVDVGAVGCFHKLPNGLVSLAAYPFKSDSLLNVLIAENLVLYKLFNVSRFYSLPTKPVKVLDISGAFMMFKKSCFDDIGGFSDEIFMYAEDRQLCRDKLYSNGYSIYLLPNIIFHAVGTQDSCRWSRRQCFASECLRRYRQGKFLFVGFTFIVFFNIITSLFLSILMPGMSQRKLKLSDFFSVLLIHLPRFLLSTNSDLRVPE